MQGRILKVLEEEGGTCEQIAVNIGAQDKAEDVFHILRHLASNGRVQEQGSGFEATFSI